MSAVNWISTCNVISLQDQQKINKFARQNQKLEDIKDDIKVLTVYDWVYETWRRLHRSATKVIFGQPNIVFNPFILSNLQARQNEIVTLTDAATDVEELALTMDDDEKVWEGQRDGYPLENEINGREILNSTQSLPTSGALPCWWNLCARSSRCCADHAWEEEVCHHHSQW